jgi:uncharacterized RDD family membrane protein YckC
MRSHDNPFAAPEVDLTPPIPKKKNSPLAERGTRFVAAFLDGFIGLLLSAPILYAFGFFDYLSKQQPFPLERVVACNALGFAAFVAVHRYFLHSTGQTLGKKAQGIRIADLNGKVPNFGRLVLLRYLPINLTVLIPVVGSLIPLVDVLFIFRRDRRCLHDLLAGTKVVKTK